MAIQVGSPLVLTLRFRDLLDTDGQTTDEGALDLAGRTLRLVLRKPDGTALEAPEPEVAGLPADGVAEVELEEGAIDQTGDWQAQGYADGYRSEVVGFRVVGNLPEPG